MKLDIQSWAAGFAPGTFDVLFVALDDNSVPLKNADGKDIHNNPGLTVNVSVPPNPDGSFPEGDALAGAILTAVRTFAARRILPAAVMTAPAAPGIVDLVPADADANAPADPVGP